MPQARTLPLPEQRAHESWLAPCLLFVAACLLFSLNLGRPPHFDELYHVLAARGWVEHGELRIAEGTYERTALFTLLIARLFQVLGESLVVARLPSLLATALLVTTLFVWVRAEAGRTAAWLAAGLYLISPFAVDLAQLIRFYALQALAFLLGTLLVHQALGRPLPAAARGLRLALALPLFLLAIYLQPTTLIGILALTLWAGMVLGLPWLLGPTLSPGQRRGLVALALLAALLALWALWLSGLGPRLLEHYLWRPGWQQGPAGAFWFYHFWLDLYYPSLWPIMPALALVALASRPMPTLLALAVFATAFLLSSFAGPKNVRYMAYALPFLFVVWGIGLAAILGPVRHFMAAVIARLVTVLPAGRGRRLAAAAAWALVLLFLVAANSASVRTLTQLAGATGPLEEPPADWAAARATLAPWLRDADIVVTNNELESLYFLGRYDVLVSRARLAETASGEEFARDHRTGRPVVASAASMARLIDCHPTGLVVATLERWRLPTQLDAAVADLIAARAVPVELPRGTNLLAYAWRHDPAAAATAPPPADCPSLQRLR